MPADIYIKSVDTRGLNRQIEQIAEVFYRRGASDTVIQQMVKIESALLAGDASDAIGPRNKTDGMNKVKGDMRTQLERKYSEQSGRQRKFFDEPDKMDGVEYSDYTWLYAGPNFLVGIENTDFKVESGSEGAYQMLRAGQKTGKRGNAWQQVGMRGKQKIMRLNRTMVSNATFAGVKSILGEKFGKAKASFASTAIALGITRKFKDFVTRHVDETVTTGRGFVDQSGLTDVANPAVTFGSHAPGVETNSKMISAMELAQKNREAILKKKLERVVAGAVYNINKGTAYRVTGRELEEDEI